MATACEIEKENSGIFGILRYSPILTLLLHIFAYFLLFYQSSGHLKACRRQYSWYLLAQLCATLLLGSGMSPILRMPIFGYQTMGFLQILNFVNMAWPVVLSIFANLMIMLTLLLLINERCMIIQKYAESLREKYQTKFAIIQKVQYLVYIFIMLSTWSTLTLTQFHGEQEPLKNIKNNQKFGVECPIFFIMDAQSWRVILISTSTILLFFLFILYAILKIKTTFEMFSTCKLRISKKVWRIQKGFLVLKIAHVGVYVVFVMLMSIILYAVSSNFVSYVLLFLITHHGTISILIFIFAHRFVRSFLIQHFNSCMPKTYRIGRVTDVSENLDVSNSQPAVQVFAVIQATSTF